ncbi:hypothetical protein J6590_068840 [Homalodisca vitripennis]|nr:hypothetical protein J6590_068840 [Homalodisca vitripennis]
MVFSVCYRPNPQTIASRTTEEMLSLSLGDRFLQNSRVLREFFRIIFLDLDGVKFQLKQRSPLVHSTTYDRTIFQSVHLVNKGTSTKCKLDGNH